MIVTQNTDGSISFNTFESMQQLVLYFLNLKNACKRDRFSKTLNIMSSKRGDLNTLAKQYYTTKNFTLLNNEIPLLINKSTFDFNLRDIFKVTLEYSDVKSPIKQNFKGLPYKNKSYVNNVILEKQSSNKEFCLNNNFCYRLTKIENSKLHFEKCEYFDYYNTCEYQFYSFTNQLIRNTVFTDKLKINKIKREINHLDFSNRYAVAGINTLLIFWDKSEPLMYLHKRNNKVAESIKMNHVVPAGTFQPIHIDDGNHNSDFCLYANIMREFGEELVGDEDLIHPKGEIENVLERSSIQKIDYIIRKMGRGKVFYGGVGIDCLTLKPEILTIMILHKSDYELLIGKINFSKSSKNNEGKPFAVNFNKQTLKKYIFDQDMLPAGAGCLWLAYKNYELLNNYMEDNKHGSD